MTTPNVKKTTVQLRDDPSQEQQRRTTDQNWKENYADMRITASTSLLTVIIHLKEKRNKVDQASYATRHKTLRKEREQLCR